MGVGRLSGTYGDMEFDTLPELDVNSIDRNDSGNLDFTADLVITTSYEFGECA